MEDVKRAEAALEEALDGVRQFQRASEHGAYETARAILEHARRDAERALNLLKKMEP